MVGSLLAATDLAPNCRVFGIEPEAGEDVRQSLAVGEPVTIPVPRTIADGAQTTRVGNTTFEIIKRHATAISTATDSQLVQEMRFLASYLKMIVEPTGRLGLAAARTRAREFAPDVSTPRVGVILSGGNVDLERFPQLIQSGRV